jgi:hypothetical protein
VQIGSPLETGVPSVGKSANMGCFKGWFDVPAEIPSWSREKRMLSRAKTICFRYRGQVVEGDAGKCDASFEGELNPLSGAPLHAWTIAPNSESVKFLA